MLEQLPAQSKLLVQQEPLAKYTSWRIGGAAANFFQPSSVSTLQQTLVLLPKDTPIHWLGLGSNVLVSDAGVDGIVIHTLKTLNQINIISCTNKALEIEFEAGVTCSKAAKIVAKQACVGAEFFAGIPGTIGGALAMNAGAWGFETWNNVTSVKTIDAQGRIHIRKPQDFTISYREVVGLVKEWFLAATFVYPIGDITLAHLKIKELLAKRSASQPIGLLNCGSVFKNPPNDHAARLIEAANLKGVAMGDAIISTKHANFIINQGKARALDVLALIEHVQKTVFNLFAVKLELEVKVLGKIDV